ncbi:hypothetical protein N7523_000451 [Penicillium sp. IBT 18751x]|nr:hypothetical protein N7523_000451 [Penicillium sp. IBT 18751x]
MGNSERRFIKFKQESIREKFHLVRTVLLRDFWKETLTDTTGPVLNYPASEPWSPRKPPQLKLLKKTSFGIKELYYSVLGSMADEKRDPYSPALAVHEGHLEYATLATIKVLAQRGNLFIASKLGYSDRNSILVEGQFLHDFNVKAIGPTAYVVGR